MKKLILGLAIILTAVSCHTRPAINLENMTFKENINTPGAGPYLIMVNHYENDHNKQWFSTEVIMLQNDQATALNRTMATLTKNREAEM